MSNSRKELRKVDVPIDKMEAPHYRYWQALYMSFYSRRLYVDVAKRWRGYGIKYFFLLMMIATIPFSTRLIIDFTEYYNQQLILPIESLPSLTVQKGKVLFDKPMPYLVKNKQNEVMAIIDTTGVIKKIDGAYPKASILITKEKIYFRPPAFSLFFSDSPMQLPDTQILSQDISKESNEVFVGKEWIASSGIIKFKHLIQYIFYPCIVMLFFSTYLTLMMMLAFIGFLFALIIFQAQFKYKEACRLFLVASTPQVFIFFTTLTIHVSVPGGNIFNIVLLAIYFNFAVISINQVKKKWLML